MTSVGGVGGHADGTAVAAGSPNLVAASFADVDVACASDGNALCDRRIDIWPVANRTCAEVPDTLNVVAAL